MAIKNEIMYAAMASMLLNLGGFAFSNSAVDFDEKIKPRIEKQKPNSNSEKDTNTKICYNKKDD